MSCKYNQDIWNILGFNDNPNSDSGKKTDSEDKEVNVGVTVPSFESIFSNPIDTSWKFSLVLDESNNNPLIFGISGGQFMSLGSFKRMVMWKKDPLMVNLMKNFWNIKKKKEWKLSYSSSDLEQRYDNRLGEIHSLTSKTPSENHIENNNELKILIEECIPPEFVIQWHLNEFFQFIYPFVPVVDEFAVNNYLKNISFSANRASIQMDSGSSLLKVSILLIILRMSYISLYIGAQLIQTEIPLRLKTILSYPVSPNVIKRVEMVLNAEKYHKSCSIESSQILMLLKVYYKWTPEEIDKETDSSTVLLMGFLSSAALGIGLNRKINEFNEPVGFDFQDLTSNKASFQQLWRKMWYFCLESDLENSASFGKFPSFDYEEADNTVPVFNLDSLNSKDPGIENFIIEKINHFASFHKLGFDLVRKLHSLKHYVTVYEVKTLLSKFAVLCDSLVWYSNGHSNQLNTIITDRLKELQVCRSKVLFGSFAMLINYYMLLYFEKKNLVLDFKETLNSEIDICCEVLSIGITEYSRILTDDCFRGFISITYTILALNKSLMLLLFLSVRLLLARHKAQSKRSNSKLKKLSTNILSIMKTLLQIIASLCPVYKSAVRTCHIYTCLIDWIEEGWKFIFNFKSRNIQAYPNLIEHFNIEELNLIDSKFRKLMKSDPFSYVVKTLPKQANFKEENSHKTSNEENQVDHQLVDILNGEFNDWVFPGEWVSNPDLLDSLNFFGDIDFSQ